MRVSERLARVCRPNRGTCLAKTCLTRTQTRPSPHALSPNNELAPWHGAISAQPIPILQDARLSASAVNTQCDNRVGFVTPTTQFARSVAEFQSAEKGGRAQPKTWRHSNPPLTPP